MSVCNGVLKKTGAYDQLSLAWRTYALALQSSAPSIMSHTSDPALNSNCDDDDGFSSCLGNGGGREERGRYEI